MKRLPLIVGFGGINAAGRSSFHQGFSRLVFDALSAAQQNEVLQDLSVLMGLDTSSGTTQHKDTILANTLVRKISDDLFDPNQVPFNQKAVLNPSGSEGFRFSIKRRELPTTLPENWSVTDTGADLLEVTVSGAMNTLIPDTRVAKVSSAGQLPTGFNPGSLYQSRNHPRGLQMTVYGASDTLQSSGLDWNTIRNRVAPDQIGVYASSAMSQLDDFGSGGMMKSPFMGKRTSSKQCPLGFAEMPADFISAYLLGSVGATGGSLGACATFLYNLQKAVYDIRQGRRRVVLVGTSEAPVLPEIMEGYRAMGALAEDQELLDLDKELGRTTPDHSRACRPFAKNCGFTIAESAQFTLLMDDELAMELGADVYGWVPDVYVHADGFKKSISAPGAGNFVTMGKAAGLVKSILGEDSLRNKSYIHAHGTSTPQNRVTESLVLNEIGKAFNIQDWPVVAIKCFLGHSIGSAGGDQIAAALGTWGTQILPGITTVTETADDIHDSNLRFNLTHQAIESDRFDSVLINSKGFGGNNGTAVLLSPSHAQQMMKARHGSQKFSEYLNQLESTKENAADYNQAALNGESKPIYEFGVNVLTDDQLTISEKAIEINGYDQTINLEIENPYQD